MRERWGACMRGRRGENMMERRGEGILDREHTVERQGNEGGER
jgi:hypothetical protein